MYTLYLCYVDTKKSYKIVYSILNINDLLNNFELSYYIISYSLLIV